MCAAALFLPLSGALSTVMVRLQKRLMEAKARETPAFPPRRRRRLPAAPLNPVPAPISPAHRQDKRVARVAEALSAMKLLKACAWEDLFARRVRDARAAELAQLRTSVGLEMLFGVLWECVPLLVALVSFAAFSLSGGTLTAPRIFTSLALFDVIRFPLLVLPEMVSQARGAATLTRKPGVRTCLRIYLVSE